MASNSLTVISIPGCACDALFGDPNSAYGVVGMHDTGRDFSLASEPREKVLRKSRALR